MALLFGIAGSLLGVIVGAFLTRWIDAGYERRAEVKRAVAGALILHEEIRDLEAGIRTLIEDPDTTPEAFLFSGLDAWESHRNVLLAMGMPHRSWMMLAALFRHFLEATPLIKEMASPRSESNVEFLKGRLDNCTEARELLAPYLVEGRIPYFRPERIFARRSRSG